MDGQSQPFCDDRENRHSGRSQIAERGILVPSRSEGRSQRQMQKLVEFTSRVVCKGVSVDETMPAVKPHSGLEVRTAPCFQAESCHSPRTRHADNVLQ